MAPDPGQFEPVCKERPERQTVSFVRGSGGEWKKESLNFELTVEFSPMADDKGGSAAISISGAKSDDAAKEAEEGALDLSFPGRQRPIWLTCRWDDFFVPFFVTFMSSVVQ